jgi:uncharacterized Zn finger protein
LEQEKNFAALTRIYLSDGEVAEALEALGRVGEQPLFGYTRSAEGLALEVARAAEAERPHDAADLYLTHVCRLIDGRGRSNYAEAARYLTRVREVYLAAGEPRTWHATIEAIRADNSALRALRDELKKAGL